MPLPPVVEIKTAEAQFAKTTFLKSNVDGFLARRGGQEHPLQRTWRCWCHGGDADVMEPAAESKNCALVDVTFPPCPGTAVTQRQTK